VELEGQKRKKSSSRSHITGNKGSQNSSNTKGKKGREEGGCARRQMCVFVKKGGVVGETPLHATGDSGHEKGHEITARQMAISHGLKRKGGITKQGRLIGRTSDYTREKMHCLGGGSKNAAQEQGGGQSRAVGSPKLDQSQRKVGRKTK